MYLTDCGRLTDPHKVDLPGTLGLFSFFSRKFVKISLLEDMRGRFFLSRRLFDESEHLILPCVRRWAWFLFIEVRSGPDDELSEVSPVFRRIKL